MDLLKDSWVVDWLREEIEPEVRAKVVAEAEAKARAEAEAKAQAERRADLRALLVDLGSKLIEPPDAATLAAVDAITDIARLRALIKRLPNAASWHALLETPAEPGSGT